MDMCVSNSIGKLEGLMSSDCNDGVKTELVVAEDMVEISMSSIHSGVKFPRGYYRFSVSG